MKRSILIALIACGWMTLLGFATSENLLETSGFEEGTYRWFESETGDPYASFVWTDEVAYTGSHALRISCSQTEPRLGKIYNSWTYEFFPHSVRGMTLELRCHVRTADVPDEHGVYIRIEAEQGITVPRILAWQASRSISGASDWTELCLQFEMPQDAQLARIHLGLAGTGNAWFDEVVLEEATDCSDPVGLGMTYTPVKFEPDVPTPPMRFVEELASPNEPAEKKDWTIIVLGDWTRSNCLSFSALRDIDFTPFERFVYEVRSADPANVLILEERPDTPSKVWQLARGGQVPEFQCVKEFAGLENVSHETLRDFLSFCETWYPSQQTLLILYGYGGGWRGTTSVLSSFQGKASWLTPSKLRDGLETIGGVDAVINAAGYMASLEAIYEISESTSLVVASEVASGYPPWVSVIDQIGALLEEYPEVSPPELGWYALDYLDTKQQLARDIPSLAAYATYQFNALGTDPVQELVLAVDDFAMALLKLLPENQEAIVELRKSALSFYYGELVDLGDFAVQCKALPELTESATAVVDALDRVVQGMRGNPEYEAVQGLNIYFPLFQHYLNTWQDYEQASLRFLVDTRWEEFLRALYADPIH